MLAVLSGGGTAGHINPALALAEVLQEQGHQVRFAGTPNGVEARLVPAAGISFEAFQASGFDRSRPWTLVTGVLAIAKSARRAKKWLRDISADVVVGFGGYVSIPVAMAAEQLGIPVVVHEQNSVMGMANRQQTNTMAYLLFLLIGKPFFYDVMKIGPGRGFGRRRGECDKLVLCYISIAETSMWIRAPSFYAFCQSFQNKHKIQTMMHPSRLVFRRLQN